MSTLLKVDFHPFKPTHKALTVWVQDRNGEHIYDYPVMVLDPIEEKLNDGRFAKYSKESLPHSTTFRIKYSDPSITRYSFNLKRVIDAVQGISGQWSLDVTMHTVLDMEIVVGFDVESDAILFKLSVDW